jgi:hypothetical protein
MNAGVISQNFSKLYEGEVMITIALKCPFFGSEDVRAKAFTFQTRQNRGNPG